MKLRILIICLTTITVMNSCKKDAPAASSSTTTDTKTALLCGKNWMMTAFTVNPGIDYYGTGTLLTNLYGTLQPCEANNLINFSTNNSYTIDEGATKCTAGASQTFETGTWAFNSDKTHLLMTETGSSTADDYTIVSLTETSAQLTQTVVAGGITYVYTETFTKQ